MFSNQTAELSLSVPVPALDAVRADKGSSRFLVGTSSVRASEDNHLHLLKYYNDANQLATTATLSHPSGPVQKIVTCPTDKTTLLTLSEDVGSPVMGGSVTLWKIPLEVMDQDQDLDYGDEDDENNDNPLGGDVTSMQEQAQLQNTDNTGAKITDMVWRGGWDEEPTSSSTQGDVMTLHADGSLTQWDAAFGAATATRHNTNVLLDGNNTKIQYSLPPHLAWDPHHADLAAVSTGTMVQVVDWRESPTSTSIILSCPHHRYGVTDLDYNPNKPHMMVTSGKDGLIKFWDLRKTSSQTAYNEDINTSPKKLKKLHPLMVARGGHSHWATKVAYNPFHDQLIVSAGTDSIVNLWRMSTISSAPLVMLEDDDDGDHENDMRNDSKHIQNVEKLSSSSSSSEGPNVRVSQYEHMDSVNAIAWGAADAWIYLSASHDGKVVLNHVPSKEKYKILL
jgi:EARP and GARP complex-interacting protein 1